MRRVYALLALGSWIVLLLPFPAEVLLAGCFSCLLLPVYRYLQDRYSRRCAMVCTALMLTLGVVLPIAIFALMVTPQAINALKMLDNLQRSGWFQGPEVQAFLDSVDEWLRLLPGMERGTRELTGEIATLVGGTVRTALRGGLGIAGSTMGLILRLCVLISLSMVGIIYASAFFRFALIVTHFPSAVLERFVRAIRQAIRSVLAGVVLVACIQGILCGFGYAAVGVKGAPFWGFLSALVAPLPLVGTGLVWIPVCIYLWFGASKGAAVGLLLWCGLAVVGADNFLRPLFLRGGLNAPFSVVLIAILCGLIAFGPVGVVAGPVLAAFALQAGREAERGSQTDVKTSPW